MKKLTFLFLVIFLVLSGCTSNPIKQESNSISVEQASSLVYEILPKKDYAYFVEHEGTQSFNGRDYHVFRAFTESSQPIVDPKNETSFKMRFTYNVYYVDVLTKKVFEMSVGGDSLIPVTKTGEGSLS